MANDKLRDLTPVDVTYVPGERPTDEKLEGAEVQTKDGFEYLEAAIGDAYGESLQTNLSYISNFTRDIGDRSKLNPVLMPDVTITNYIQDLTLGDMEHELDLIPVGTGVAIIPSSADSSVVPGQFKTSVDLLEVPGDWTILPGKTEDGVVKNSRKLVTHSPSSGDAITFAEVTSGRGSSYIGARHNTIPSIAQARSGGPFLAVSVSDAINNIYTIQLPSEDRVEDELYNDTNATLSNIKSSVGTGQPMKLPKWLFDIAGLDMGSDAGSGGPKVFPQNTIQLYDWQEKKIVDGLLEVKASNTIGLREQEIICTLRSDIILDDVAGQYVIVTSGTSIAEQLGALQRDFYFHKHMGDDMVRAITHSDLMDLRTGDDTLDRTKYYGASNIDNNDHSMYLHRDGYTIGDIGAGGNVMRGSLVIGSTDTGTAGSHENFNLLANSHSVSFGQLDSGGKIYFDKIRVHNIAEGRGNIPLTFSDTAIVIEGSLDDGTGLLRTTLIDGNLRVDGDVVLGTDQTHDVIISGDLYVKNSVTLIPRTTGGLVPETGMSIYSSDENAPIFWNGTAWVNSNSIGYAAVVGDGVISFGKYNGTDAATLQAAIADAVAQGGGKVRVLRGAYNYGATAVAIPSVIAIEGEGASTIIDASGTAFAFDAGSVHSSVSGLLIQNATIAISLDGTEHFLGVLDIHDCNVGIELKAATDKVGIRTSVRFTNVNTKIDVQTTNTGIRISNTESVGYAQRLYLTDVVDKVSQLDKWKRISGAGAMSYVHDTNCVVGKGHFEISGTGLFVFEDYIPVMPMVGIGGYLGIHTGTAATANIGYLAYDANLSLLSGNGGFIEHGYPITPTWEFLQDICVEEAAGDINKFPIGTRFVRASIEITANSGTVLFDGFQIIPLTFSTISLYS